MWVIQISSHTYSVYLSELISALLEKDSVVKVHALSLHEFLRHYHFQILLYHIEHQTSLLHSIILRCQQPINRSDSKF